MLTVLGLVPMLPYLFTPNIQNSDPMALTLSAVSCFHPDGVIGDIE